MKVEITVVVDSEPVKVTLVDFDEVTYGKLDAQSCQNAVYEWFVDNVHFHWNTK